MTLWIDVEDIFHFSTLGARPSGIQRVSFELSSALRGLPGLDVRFIRNDAATDTFREVLWDEVQGLYHRLAHAPLPASGTRGSKAGAAPSWLRTFLGWLPQEVAEPLALALRAQKAACGAAWSVLRQLVAAVLRRLSRRGAAAAKSRTAPQSPGLGIGAAHGDTICVLGAPWHVDYTARLKRMQESGLKFAVLVHDILPIVRPEFVMAKIKGEFEPWYRACLPNADHVLSVSRSTARDLEDWARRTALPLRAPVMPIRLGPGLNSTPRSARASGTATLPAGLCPGEYVLIVSTLEVRKNHILAFRAWRRLLEMMPRQVVPTLVFAGHIGWTAQDLLQEIENSDHLDGKLVIAQDPTDKEISALYLHCMFTLFPSHYEGWGLPVAESLDYGKVCLASRSSSITEIAPGFCLFFDPASVAELVGLVRFVLENPEVIPAIEARIRDGYVPTGWDETARAIADRLLAAPPPPMEATARVH